MFLESGGDTLCGAKKARPFKTKSRKVEFILTIERLWEEYALAFDLEDRQKRLDKLLKILFFTIKHKAEALKHK